MLALAGVNGLFFVRTLAGLSVSLGPSFVDMAFLPVGAAFLIPVMFEFRHHFPIEDRREVTTDVALITAALGAIAYLYLAYETHDPVTTVSSAVFALIAATAITSYGALALWVPSPAHLGLLAVMSTYSGATFAFGVLWVRGEQASGHPWIDLPFAIGGLALAGLTAAVPRRSDHEPPAEPARYGRPLLTAAAVATACAALAVVAILAIGNKVGELQASVLIALLGSAVAVRILVNQLRSTGANREARTALAQKEAALAETDLALDRLRRANETLRKSEERLRAVFEAAVDGIVEMDDNDVVVRVNSAFCRMIDLPQNMVEGQPWSAIAASVGSGDESFTELPVTGQGVLRRQGSDTHLEARVSDIPGDPPRRLLLVRDVTAARVADQTIRSLFKFLQDRDEDRTRIMRRTNAAIEGERNRIARDLHDGPVQGVSAASLSLEAIQLMIKAGEIERGLEVLGKVRKELSEEADNLRLLMSGLRPPLLEERGLMPAIRETLAKFQRDTGIRTDFDNPGPLELPNDLETLAYRVVQEALSNAAKHSNASSVTITVELVTGQLRVEVVDDGMGFESERAREYLQEGRVGLASMRERVELANGVFMVHSSPGKGTTVLATLPLEEVTAAREAAAR
jgi:PAS domain S-box-containing protein